LDESLDRLDVRARVCSDLGPVARRGLGGGLARSAVEVIVVLFAAVRIWPSDTV
jgi:hypothetical protein